MPGYTAYIDDGRTNLKEPIVTCGKTTAAINKSAALTSSSRKALFLIDTQNGNLRLAQNEALMLTMSSMQKRQAAVIDKFRLEDMTA